MKDIAPKYNNLSRALLYHEINQDKVSHTLKLGLRKSSNGDKEDETIIKTNLFLNKYTPERLRSQNLSRTEVLYPYYAQNGLISDIEDGRKYTPDSFPLAKNQTLLAIQAPLKDCFISDLDLFDETMARLKAGNETRASLVANQYWQAIIPMDNYRNSIRRPEVIVTADIPSKYISIKRESNPKQHFHLSM